MADGDRNIFALATGTFAVNLDLIAWGILAMVIVDGLCVVLFGGAPRFVMNFLFGTLVLHAALRTLLSGGQVTGLKAALKPNGQMPWSFILRVFMLSVPGVLGVMTVGGLLLPFGNVIALFGGVTVGLVVQAGVLALFGQMLTDIAAGGEGEATQALERGQGHFMTVFRLMLIGPTAMELGVFLIGRAVDAIGLSDRVAEAEAAHINPIGAMIDALLLAGGAAVAVLTAAVLIEAWRDRPA